MSEYTCPNCSCDNCDPPNQSYAKENERLMKVVDNLEAKITRLENHVIQADRINEELKKANLTQAVQQ